MYKNTVLTAALTAAFCAPMSASAADDKELAAIREQIRQMKDSYEARLKALEQRLEEAQAAVAQAQNAAQAAQASAAPPAAPQPAPAPVPQAAPQLAQAAPNAPQGTAAAAAANAFNPQMSLVLTGTYANLSRDPNQYHIGGFIPPDGEVGPGRRSFNLGESEITLSANIDPMFSGWMTFALSDENEVSVEESYVQTRGLGNGANLKFGRYLSALGYLNSQHAHAWDFVDAPLAYQAFFGGQYKVDGLQARWLAPTNTFLELGAEVGSGRFFPGTDRNKNGIGSTTIFAHVGDDIGDSASWRAGLSYLNTRAQDRSFDENGLPFAYSGPSRLWVADAIYKWAPNGNPTQQNFKLQGEYLRRKESGTLAAGDEASGYNRTQSGWYLQGVYQFMPTWRVGLRYDRLSSGSLHYGLTQEGALDASAFPSLVKYSPSRSSLMFDWSPSEFSRLRLQLARDKARSDGGADNQIFLQYIMSLGTHAAHAF